MPMRKCDVYLKRWRLEDLRVVLVLQREGARDATRDFKTEKELNVCVDCVEDMNFRPVKSAASTPGGYL